MVDANKKTENSLKSLTYGLYFAIGIPAVTLILQKSFNAPFQYAIAAAILVVSLTAYPLFIRRSGWKRHWTFLRYEALSLTASIIVFFLCQVS